jgi:hypothetical protein
MKRTYDYGKKPSQSTTSFKPTTSYLQTRGFAPLQTDLDENATFRPSGYSENFLEKIINQRSTESSDPPIQRKPHQRLKAIASQHMAIQAKLNIGEPNDKYEKEADDTGSKVVQQINSTSQDNYIQRQESMKEEDEKLQMKSLVQRRENLGGGEASTDLESSIQSARGSGQSLDAGLQAKMGQAMGADFSGVKVHTDSQSDQLNQSIQAKAFTTGQDVFFRQEAYKPNSRSGQELIAHELTHVVQQGGAVLQCKEASTNSELSVLQRAFHPSETTDKAHLHTTTDLGKVKDSFLGYTGDQIPTNTEVIVDYDDQYLQKRLGRSSVAWVKAFNKKAADWDENDYNNRTNAPYIRKSKTRLKTDYPKQTTEGLQNGQQVNAQWHWFETYGEVVKLAESGENPGNWIAKYKKGGMNQFKLFAPDGSSVKELSVVDKLKVAAESLVNRGSIPEENLILVKSISTQKMFLYHTDTKVLEEKQWTPQQQNVASETDRKNNMMKTLAGAQIDLAKLNNKVFPYKHTEDADSININIKGSPEESNYAQQVKAVEDALLLMQSQHVILLDGLTFVLSSSANVSQQGYAFGPGYIVLKPLMFSDPKVGVSEAISKIKGGTPDQSDNSIIGVTHQQNVGQTERATAIGKGIAIHEIGHLKHAQTSPIIFGNLQKMILPDNIGDEELNSASKKISHYVAMQSTAHNKALELVAEVFTGVTLGLQYDGEVMKIYKALGGPNLSNPTVKDIKEATLVMSVPRDPHIHPSIIQTNVEEQDIKKNPEIKALKDLGDNANVFLMEVNGKNCVVKFQGQKACQEEIILGKMGKIIGLEYTEPELVMPGEGDHKLYVQTIHNKFKVDPTASNGKWLMIMPMEKFNENKVSLSEEGFEKYGRAYAFDLFTYGKDKWKDDMLANLFVTDAGNFIMLDTNTKLNGTEKLSAEGTERMKNRLSEVTRKKYFEFAMKSAGEAASNITKSQQKKLHGAFLQGVVNGMREILNHSDDILKLQSETKKSTKEKTGNESPSGFINDLDMKMHLENLSKVLKSKSSMKSEGKVYKFLAA